MARRREVGIAALLPRALFLPGASPAIIYRMKRLSRTLVLVLILALVTPALVTAEESLDLGQFIRRSGAHKIGGYVTLGLAVTTVGLGLLRYPVHPYLGYATVGFAATASIAGTIAYKDQLPVIWPHAVLNGLAVTGFAVNAFFLEGGSPAHIATGLGSLALMGAAYTSIILITR
jgi:hypothetical protein